MKRFGLFTMAAMLASVSVNALELNAESYYIVEPETGTVVLEKNADKLMGPASLTKLMTLYLLFESLDRGDITLDTEFDISEKAWRKGGSKMFLEVGKKVRVEDLIKGIAVSSGNDACIVVSENLGGTEDGFATMMNEKALDLKMFNTTFKNSSGWPDPDQVSTAKDMTLLGRALIKNFPEYYSYFSIQRFKYSDISQPNRNGLLRRNVGVDGMKTGHIDEAGYHIVTSAKRNDVRLVSSLMGANSMRAREDETLTGLSYAFRTHRMHEAVTKNHMLDEKAPVWMGVKDEISLKTAEGVTMYLSSKDRNKVKAEVVYTAPIEAPVELGEKVGVLKLTNPTSGKEYTVDVITAESVDEVGMFSKFGRYIAHGLGL